MGILRKFVAKCKYKKAKNQAEGLLKDEIELIKRNERRIQELQKLIEEEAKADNKKATL